MVRAHLVPAVAVAVALALGACGDSRREGGPSGSPTSVPRASAAGTLSATICDLWMRRCGCSRTFFPSYEDCRDGATSFQEDQFAMAETAGALYSAECMAELVNALDDVIGCRRLSELTRAESAALTFPADCKPFHGTGTEGEACSTFDGAYGDTCAQGLRCLGTCMAIPAATPRAEGEVCTATTDVCELGTSCTDDGAGTTSCARDPGEGEPCTVGCDVGFSCRGTTDRVCLPPPGRGEECVYSTTAPPCAADLYCGDAGTCIDALPEGAVCTRDDECGAGFACREVTDGGDDVCAPEEPAICV